MPPRQNTGICPRLGRRPGLRPWHGHALCLARSGALVLAMAYIDLAAAHLSSYEGEQGKWPLGGRNWLVNVRRKSWAAFALKRSILLDKMSLCFQGQ